MKIAVVYNRDSQNVINLFGLPNREKIGLKTIKRLADALKAGGHQVIAIEGDKDLVDKLEEFMPRVVTGERPGMVFNVSYGIQGQARYTHVPSILEMVGIPYVASGPLAHSLALDKVVTKMILRQHGLPTPDFAVLDNLDAPLPDDLRYPLIVKPKNEAVSFGLRVCNDETELREGAAAIFDKFGQAVLAEQYIEGREVNVGLLGNGPPEAFPPVELLFGEGGPAIYTNEDKTGRSGRSINHHCPAPIGEALLQRAQEIAVKAFDCLGCYDCARVDMRLDADGQLYVLEVNSLPSLGEHGSYLIGADHVGLDFPKFVNRLVEVASARYFGTPEPPMVRPGKADPSQQVFQFVTQRRDVMEQRLRDWVAHSSHTDDPVGVHEAVRRAGRTLEDVGLRPVETLTGDRAAWTWETPAGVEGGTLFIGHLDVPSTQQMASPQFRREPEWLFGDGIGSSRAPFVMLEFALRALRSARRLRKSKLGVLLYTDEGRDARYSAGTIQQAVQKAGRVLVLRPGVSHDSVVVQRRGLRKYRFRAVDEPRRIGRASKKPELLRWFCNRLDQLSELTSSKERLSVSTIDIQTEGLPMLLPHRATAEVLATYPEPAVMESTEARMRELLGRGGPRWELKCISDRPPMRERKRNVAVGRALAATAEKLDIALKRESSAWPSVAGLVPSGTPCLCGVGPMARDVGTPHESVQRIALIQRTLLLAEFLLEADR